ncbi:uncharacterized protein DUF3558 [Herbihabitans rhizosphaerae]|uniref:Uncharacterized protein DUF3558 n=1 Tax=Herbihabitans rhizosphaerae TaxID=1872711 RepID=A0A4Q7KQ44_9PSEU|nr:DUF3558 family protein [Herbihabitans rhizosphaerae]RZS37821.1 uncharacterized protein DUF3558 [Herbihabitans rhizosphaerae]
MPSTSLPRKGFAAACVALGLAACGQGDEQQSSPRNYLSIDPCALLTADEVAPYLVESDRLAEPQARREDFSAQPRCVWRRPDRAFFVELSLRPPAADSERVESRKLAVGGNPAYLSPDGRHTCRLEVDTGGVSVLMDVAPGSRSAVDDDGDVCAEVTTSVTTVLGRLRW